MGVVIMLKFIRARGMHIQWWIICPLFAPNMKYKTVLATFGPKLLMRTWGSQIIMLSESTHTEARTPLDVKP